jgi:hypothetical protein
MKKFFETIYEKQIWGNGSGGGSSAEYNRQYIFLLRNFLIKNKIKSVVDLGCGDWQCTELIYKHLNIDYLGLDCVSSVIEENTKKFSKYKFKCTEFLNEEIPEAEVYILKDVLQHWSPKQIVDFLNRLIKKPFKFIIITNCCDQKENYKNEDINLENKSFSHTIKLNSQYYPLNQFNCKSWFTYNTKEVSIITPLGKA